MNSYSDEEAIIENFNWNQLSLEKLKKIQPKLSKAIDLKKQQLKLAASLGSDHLTYRYKASLSKVFPSHLRFSLSEYDQCIFLISLGSKHTCIERIDACFKWLSNNFENCLILVTDSLYRLTIQVRQGGNEKQAREEALETGRAFIDKCYPIIETYSEKCKFGWILTSELETRLDFPSYYEQLKCLYTKNGAFQKMVNNFAQAYLSRDQIADTSLEKKLLAITYLLEEAALFTCLAQEGWSVFLYPGSIKTFEEIAEGLHPDVPQPLQQIIWSSLRLRRQHSNSHPVE